jgi:hypothetical protein
MNMYLYRIYGLGVESDYQIKEADAANYLHKVDVTIKEGIINGEFSKDRIRDIQEDRFLVNVTEDGIYLQVAHQGTFLMEEGKIIRYHLKPESNHSYIEQIILCFCLCVVLVQQNKLVLHGSGIIIQNKVFVISGKSGAGKSTLSTALINSGYQYIADDAVAIECLEEIKACSGYPQRKLCFDTLQCFDMKPEDYPIVPDAEGVKYSIKQLDQYNKEALTLGGLVVITPGEGEVVKLIRVSGTEKIKLIMDNLYKKEIYNLLGFNKDLFDQCVKIAKYIDVYVLTRPVNRMTIKEQVKALNSVLIGAE